MLATKDFADATEALIAPIPEQAPAGWKKILEDQRIREQDKQEREVVAALVKQMRVVPEGTFFSSCPDGTETLPEVFPLPARVAILIDGRCASTTEQFLLEARQSKKVILFGQPSDGCLDYANVCFLMLPSGKFFLTMPTSRSRRLPKNPVDNIGIAPDVLIPDLTRPQTSGDSAVNFVQDYLKQHPLPNKPQK
jgi:C-terminal processing protease CtpA/Prc